MSQLTFGDKTYAIRGALSTFTQLHIARKLGPSVPIVEGLIDPKNAEKDKAILTVLMFSHISDESTEFVIKNCLSVVHRKGPDDKFAPIMSQGQLMFDDITMSQMLELAIMVIEETLGDFFRTALTNMGRKE